MTQNEYLYIHSCMTDTKLQKTAQAITNADNNNFFHPWEYMGDHGHNERTIIESANGVYIKDIYGNELLDAPAGMWCVQVGHGRKEIADAVHAQIMKIPYFSPFGVTNPIATQLAERLADKAPGDCTKVFFTTGGSTAVDSAVRFVHYYNNLKNRPNKKIILSREFAFHGSTYMTASLCGKERDRSFFDIHEKGVHILPHVNPIRRSHNQSVEEFCDEKIQDLRDAITKIGAQNIGAFIGEPVQASGGVIVAPEGYLKRVWQICKENDILFIADEVVTGFGRLGHWFSIEKVFGIQPDMVTMAKGLTSGYVPMGALMISKKLIDEVGSHKDLNPIFSNGYTYAGHPVSAAAAMASMDIIENENLLERVRELTPYFQDSLNSLNDLPLVGNTRGMGLMGCMEIKTNLASEGELLKLDKNIAAMIDAHCQKMGLLVRPMISSCVMSPPFTITKPQIGTIFKTLRRGIEMTQDDLRAQGRGHIFE